MINHILCASENIQVVLTATSSGELKQLFQYDATKLPKRPELLVLTSYVLGSV